MPPTIISVQWCIRLIMNQLLSLAVSWTKRPYHSAERLQKMYNTVTELAQHGLQQLCTTVSKYSTCRNMVHYCGITVKKKITTI